MPLRHRRRPTKDVTVRVYVTGAGPRPIQALVRYGEITSGSLQGLQKTLVDGVAKLGVDCKGARNDQKGELNLSIPRDHWNVRGVREQVEDLIYAATATDDDEFSM